MQTVTRGEFEPTASLFSGKSYRGRAMQTRFAPSCSLLRPCSPEPPKPSSSFSLATAPTSRLQWRAHVRSLFWTKKRTPPTHTAFVMYQNTRLCASLTLCVHGFGRPLRACVRACVQAGGRVTHFLVTVCTLMYRLLFQAPVCDIQEPAFEPEASIEGAAAQQGRDRSGNCGMKERLHACSGKQSATRDVRRHSACLMTAHTVPAPPTGHLACCDRGPSCQSCPADLVLPPSRLGWLAQPGSFLGRFRGRNLFMARSIAAMLVLVAGLQQTSCFSLHGPRQASGLGSVQHSGRACMPSPRFTRHLPREAPEPRHDNGPLWMGYPQAQPGVNSRVACTAVLAVFPLVSAAEDMTAFKSSGAADVLGSLEIGVLVLGIAVLVRACVCANQCNHSLSSRRLQL